MQTKTTKKPKLKFVYWFSFYNIHSPTVRYRGKFTTDYLKEEYGIGSHMIMPSYKPATVLRFIRAYLSALFFLRRNSVVVVQSVYTRSRYATLLKFLVWVRKNSSFYDLDDADYLRYPPDTIYHFLRHCSAITLGSTELVKNLSKFNKNCILLTCPVKDLGIVKKERSEVFTIGWIGDFTKVHKESLMNMFFPALVDLPFQFRLSLLGVCRKEEHEFLMSYLAGFKNVEIDIPETVHWMDEEAIQKKIATFDIGIATLLDDEFSRSKSAFKLKQCLNNGVPVLSSDIAENNLFIDDGRNGYLCRNSEDFRRRLIEFSEMPAEKYKVFSDNARADISRFDLRHYCDRLIDSYGKYCN